LFIQIQVGGVDKFSLERHQNSMIKKSNNATPNSKLNSASGSRENHLVGMPSAFSQREKRDHPLRNHLDRWGSSGVDNIEIPPHWSVPWADLMMVMMVMFAVMFISQKTERNVGDLFKKEAKNQPRIAHQVKLPALQFKKVKKAPISAEEILRLSEILVTQVNLDDVDVVLTENQAVKVSVRGNLLFDSGKANLKSDATSFLDKLANIISTNNYQIEVIGHTDNSPISNPDYPTNWELSSARSAQVARYLIQTGNLEPGRFSIIGRASYQPVTTNTTPEDKSRNRRVEIIITRNEYKS
jgi:chemotaxis protein MotB